MKKRKHCFQLFFSFLIIFCLVSCLEGNRKDLLKNYLGIDVSSGDILVEFDNHGGCHGDGDTYIEMSFARTPKDIVTQIENNVYWHSYPLPPTMEDLVSIKIDNQNGLFYIFPVIDNGFYYFCNRNSEAEDRYLPALNCFNYLVALYDLSSNMLYYYQSDM